MPKSMRKELQTYWLTYYYLFLVAPPVADDTNENWRRWKCGDIYKSQCMKRQLDESAQAL